MTRPRQRDIDAQNREMDALAERWEIRIHAIAFTLTAVVLGMRLVAGRQDLTSDDARWSEPSSEPSVAALPAAPPPHREVAAGARSPESTGDPSSNADSPAERETSPDVGVP